MPASSERFECALCSHVFFKRRSIVLHIRRIHRNFDKFECALCNTTFTIKDSLKRHIKRKHTAVHPSPSMFKCVPHNEVLASQYSPKCRTKEKNAANKLQTFECASCDSAYTAKNSLKRHMKNKHTAAHSQTFECDQCSPVLLKRRSSKEHVRCIHDDSNKFECALCSHVFLKRRLLVQHIRRVHRASNIFECFQCTRTFSSKYVLARHIRHHSKKRISDVNRFRCALCNQVFESKVFIKAHLSDVHSIMLEIQTKHFKSYDEFQKWKTNIQFATICQFINIYSKISNSHHRKVFVCHRSSICRSHSRKKTDNKFPRRNGSKKLLTYCPGEMEVRISTSDGSCVMKYTSTHMGHPLNDPKELRHIYLKADERLNIASHIFVQDSVPSSEEGREELSSENISMSSSSILPASDVRNIECSFYIDEHSLNDDDFCMDMFIKNNEDSILLFKDQSTEDSRFGILQKDDFALILMNQTQEKYLRHFAEKVVCFDGMLGTNKYGFFLHTLLVLDVDRVGYPAAFILTNRNDQTIIDVFLTCIKERVGIIRTRVIMTDSLSMYYNSWISIMDPEIELHLHCTWRVNEAWRRNYMKLPDTAIGREVKRQLHSLRYELNPLEFDQKLAAFLDIEDDSVQNFMQYFRQNYTNMLHLWAYSHEQHPGINVNMSLESFYKQFKYHIAHGKIIWISQTLRLIKEYLDHRDAAEEAKNICGKTSFKLKKLRKAHHESRKHFENKDIENYVDQINESITIVKSFTDGDISYVVTKLPTPKECSCFEDVSCGLHCDLCHICFHEYICDCLENSIKNYMCKHIHTVGIFNQRQNANVNIITIDLIPANTPVVDGGLNQNNNVNKIDTNDDETDASENDATMDNETFEKLKKEAHESLDRGIEAGRCHGMKFLTNCLKRYIDEMEVIAEVFNLQKQEARDEKEN